MLSSFYTSCTLKMGFVALSLLCGSICIFLILPLSLPEPPSAPETAQYKGEVFIGAILHLLEAADS